MAEYNPFEVAQRQVDKCADFLKLDPGHTGYAPGAKA